jgi:hypothetical protein
MMEQKILLRDMKTFQKFCHTVVRFRSMSPETKITSENDYKTGNTDVSREGLGSMKVLSQSAQSHSRLQSHKSTN